LPEFLAARLSGTLDEVEAVVLAVEEAGGVAAVLDTVHPADAEDAIGLQGAQRSPRRRVGAVHAVLLAIITLLPEWFAGVVPTVKSLRAALSTRRAEPPWPRSTRPVAVCVLSWVLLAASA
jgi:hypothetical protein